MQPSLGKMSAYKMFNWRDQNFLIKRFAEGAGFLGAVEHGDGADRGGEGGEEVFGGERTEKTNLEDADLFSLGDQVVYGFLGDIAARAHENDDALSISCADVFKELVLTSGDGGETVHRILQNGGYGEVVGIDGLARLEIDIGILRGAAENRMVGREGTLAMLTDELVRQHGAHVVLGQLLDLADLVRGAEAVEEMDEGNLGLEGCGLSDKRAGP